jgi:hypothetical protein
LFNEARPGKEAIAMSDNDNRYALLVGRAALQLWPDLPRDIQEALFETTVPNDEQLRHDLAVFLHERHPRTAHPPRPDAVV